jgi:hypothetical protein
MPRTGPAGDDGARSPGGRAAGRLGTVGQLVAGALVLVGCGTQQVLENDVAGPVTAPPPTATTVATVPETTTTTIDFDRPVVQGDDPLEADAGPGEVATLVGDIRGQTADVDAQIRRLAPFPDLAGAPVAQILDLAISLAPETDDGHPAAARVRYRVPDRGADAAKAIDDELRSLGWFTADGTSSTAPDGATWDMVFRIPGRAAETVELRAVVEELPGVTIVDLEYVVLADDDEVLPTGDEAATYLDRLAAWTDDLPLPRASSLTEVGIETAPEEGTLSARFRLPADDEAEAVAAVFRSIGSRGYQLRDGAADEAPSAGPLDLVDEDGSEVLISFRPAGEPGSFVVEASISFPLTPLD